MICIKVENNIVFFILFILQSPNTPQINPDVYRILYHSKYQPLHKVISEVDVHYEALHILSSWLFFPNESVSLKITEIMTLYMSAEKALKPAFSSIN